MKKGYYKNWKYKKYKTRKIQKKNETCLQKIQEKYKTPNNSMTNIKIS